MKSYVTLLSSFRARRAWKSQTGLLRHFTSRNDKSSGFTIIELLIYTALFAIVLSVALSLLFQSRNLETDITQYQEVERNGRVALLEMTQTIHGAQSVTSPALGATATTLSLNGATISYAVNSGILQKTEGGQIANVTSSGVTVQNLTFTTRGEAGKSPTVSITFTLKANTRVYGESKNITKSYQTTIQLR